MAPRKSRLVADLIRGKKAVEAKTTLLFCKRAAAKPFAKLLNSGLSNAKNNFQIEEENLYLAQVLVDEGSKLKRWRPRARGRAFPIQKKTSHLTLILKEIEGTAKLKQKRGLKAGEQPVEIKERPVPKEILEKPKPRLEREMAKPKQVSALKRIFRRKAF